MEKNNMLPDDQNQHISASTALDDEQRVKVLSPTMMVFKRFVRNKLAITGFSILVVMFLFSFLGGTLSLYGEFERFRGYELMSKEYAAVTVNSELRYTTVTGAVFPDAVKAKVVMAVQGGDSVFTVNNDTYLALIDDNGFIQVFTMHEVTTGSEFRGVFTFDPDKDGKQISSEITDGLSKAVSEGRKSFTTSDGTYYSYKYERKLYTLMRAEIYALATKNVFDVLSADVNVNFEFRLNAENALSEGDSSFTANGLEYVLETVGDNTDVYQAGQLVCIVSPFAIKEIEPGTNLTLDFKAAAQEAVTLGMTSFTLPDENGETVNYEIIRKGAQFIVMKDMETYLIRMFESPSAEHLLGTDGNGMDVLTRLMYGGRISLIIGFVVVMIEITLGVIMGGIAGYFGKWIDNLIMRVVDVFYCIPTLPLYIIIGAVMDSLKIDPRIRIYLLMLMLGILGWPSIARMVRGQILSLREQEFMTATEATGLSVSRRIFKHLVPNVVPQLIVISTMTLGSIILTEATLSFLGLGVKYPYASWGNIINAVSNSFVLTNYWFVWIPAGLCILITVLGFNFVGDGLRDAFDPKMKR